MLEHRHLLAGDLIGHFSAESITGLNSGDVVNSWIDSESGFSAELDAGAPSFVANEYGGRSAIRFDATDGDDSFLLNRDSNPVAGLTDYSVVVVFATSSNELVGDSGQWFETSGIVDANTLGFSKDWGVGINSSGQIATGASVGGLLQNSSSLYSTETGLNDGQLHVATVTNGGGSISVYVDDGNPTTESGFDEGARALDRVAIGRLVTRKNGFNGDITELRFYNGKLSADEVSALHTEIQGFYNNSPPVPVDDQYETREDVFLGVTSGNGVLANDIDAEGDELTAEVITQPANGRLGFQSNGGFFYTPDKNFFGVDTFTYRVSDFRQADQIGTVSITVTSQYDPPKAIDDVYTGTPKQLLRIPNWIGVLQNDENPDDAQLKAVLVQDVANGNLTLREDGSFDYDAQGFAGITSFQYAIDDGTNVSDPATALLRINTKPVSVDDTFAALEDVELSVPANLGVLANDIDEDGNSLTATLVDTTTNGTLTFNTDGSFTYLGNAEYSGSDSFTYRVSDGQEDSEIATATINVTIVNDVPVANSDSYFSLPGESLSTTVASGVLANDFDIDGPELTARVVDEPENGVLTFQPDGSFSYVPNEGFTGVDGFTYVANDSVEDSQPTRVEIQITNKPILINEIMVSNATTIDTIVRTDLEADFEGEQLTPDWIEIRNLLPTPLNVGGLHLTDDADELTKWTIPNGTVIPGDGYLVVFASGLNIDDPGLDQNGFLHTNFSLSTGGEYLAITSTSGDVIDELKDGYPNQRTHITYGADANNVASLGFFMEPTPGKANSSQLSSIVKDTKFNIDRGFFVDPIEVTITSATEGAEIRYTLDGTDPTETNGTVYSAPLNVSSTTTLRAAAFKDGMVPTNIDTRTYLFLDDILGQNQSDIIDAGFPNRWKGTSADYGLDDPDEFPRIAGDQSLSVDEAKQVIADALTAIPSFSIVTDVDNLWDPNVGIYANPTNSGKSWERPTSVEMVHPDGTEGFQIDAGIRIQGGAFRNWGLTKKKSFRLLFKTQYGPGKLNYPLFGPDAATEFDTLTLRMEANDGWQWNGAGGQPQFARDQFLRNVQRAMGQPASHGRAIHVYLNGLYWGMYNLVERPDASFGAAYLGADKYDWDGTNSGSAINAEGDSFRNSRTRNVWRDFTRLTREVRSADTEIERTNMYLQLQGMNPDGSRNPDFPVYLDPENMSDYFIVNYYGDNSDWPFKNYYYGRENSPDSDGFQFFMWDAEWSLFLRSNVTSFSKINDRSGVALPFQDMRNSEEFRVVHGDRVHKHFFNGGVFYVDSENPEWDPDNPERNRPAQLYNEYVNEIFDALPAESARWGDQHRRIPYTRDTEWQREYNRLIEDWFPRRSELLLNRYIRDGLYPSTVAATFSQRGGAIQSDVPITLSAPKGNIYYTTDGSDPRLIGGAVNPSAMLYSDPISLDGNTTIKVRVQDGDEWSAIDEAMFVTDAVPATADSLRISEINYNPAPRTDAEIEAGVAGKDEFEFIEFVNVSDQTIDLSTVSLQQTVDGDSTVGVDFNFSDGAIQKLQPGERVLVVENLEAFKVRYSQDLPVAGQWSGGLSNDSEMLTVGTSDQIFQQFAYADEWHPATDGLGRSLEIVDASAADLASWGTKEAWRVSGAIGGSPGTEGGPVQNLIGDSNHDGIFDSSDLVLVFAAGEYEDDVAGNSTFEEGDWNGDGDFDSSDLVRAFQEGNYVAGAVATSKNHLHLAGALGKQEQAQNAAEGTTPASDDHMVPDTELRLDTKRVDLAFADLADIGDIQRDLATSEDLAEFTQDFI